MTKHYKSQHISLLNAKIALVGLTTAGLIVNGSPATAQTQDSEIASEILSTAEKQDKSGTSPTPDNPLVSLESNEIVLSDKAGDTSFTVDLPTDGSESIHNVGDLAIFDGTGESNIVAVQETEDGVRALIHIADKKAPTRYEFPLEGDIASLSIEADGSAVGYDGQGLPIAFADRPWASDAKGRAVPTHFEAKGTTLIQVVEHTSKKKKISYPVIADPNWWHVAKCTAAIGGFIAGNVLAASKVKKAGGVAKAATKLMKAANTTARWTAAKTIFGEVTGIGSIISNCK